MLLDYDYDNGKGSMILITSNEKYCREWGSNCIKVIDVCALSTKSLLKHMGGPGFGFEGVSP